MSIASTAVRPLWQVICHGESCDLCEPVPEAPEPEAKKVERVRPAFEPRVKALLDRQDAVFDDWRY